MVLWLAACGMPNPTPAEDVSAPTVPPSPATELSPTAPPTATSAPVTSTDDVKRISPAEARVLVESGQAVLLDTRSAESYGSMHAAGALSFPESEAPNRLDELPADKVLIFY
jgi:hypothetical protein